MNEKLEVQAKHLDQIVEELEQAVAHAKTAPPLISGSDIGDPESFAI